MGMLKCVGRQLRSTIFIRELSSDEAKVDVEWRKEVGKETAKMIRLDEVSSSSLPGMKLHGTAEFDPGFELQRLSTVKTSPIGAILVKD